MFDAKLRGVLEQTGIQLGLIVETVHFADETVYTTQKPNQQALKLTAKAMVPGFCLRVKLSKLLRSRQSQRHTRLQYWTVPSRVIADQAHPFLAKSLVIYL